MSFRILVMAKAPVPGTVKTRLRLAPDDAARLQEAFIQDTVVKVRDLARTTVAGAPGEKLHLIRQLLPKDVPLIPQSEGDLGERMLAGVRTLFSTSDDPVIVLGTDAPTLPPAEILKSARALDSHDLSIIQSADGGYVLLGLARPAGEVFSGIAWSTDAVYRQTLVAAGAAGLSVYEGAAWYDVDEPEDLERLREHLAERADLAPRAAKVLRSLSSSRG